MSITVQFFTVVVKVAVIKASYPGGLGKYLDMPYVWHDGSVVGSSFMNVLDVNEHCRYLEKCGIAATEVAVVHQIQGILSDCDWLTFGRWQETSCCWLRGECPGEPVMPKENIG